MNAIAIIEPTITDLYQRFINYIDAKPKTVETYTKALHRLFGYFASHHIKEPQRSDILAYKEHLIAKGLNPTTIQSYITITRIFFNWTAQEGLYPNIAERIKGVKLNREHKKDYLISSQVKGLLPRASRIR